MTCGWTFELIAALPLPRVWKLMGHWSQHPPTHRLLALFLEYGKSEGTAQPAKNKGFEITPGMLDAFGGASRRVCRESQLPPRMRKTLEEFHSTEAYKNWRSKLAGR